MLQNLDCILEVFDLEDVCNANFVLAKARSVVEASCRSYHYGLSVVLEFLKHLVRGMKVERRLSVGVIKSLSRHDDAPVNFCLGIEVSDATLPVMACSMPFWLAGFWRPKGLVAEKFIPLYMEHALSDGKLAYRASNDLGTLAQIEKPKPDRRARRLAKRKGAERRDLSET